MKRLLKNSKHVSLKFAKLTKLYVNERIKTQEKQPSTSSLLCMCT